MRNKMIALLALTFLSTLNHQLSTAHAQGTAFTYQGRLISSGTPANGSYDLTFALFNTNSTGAIVAGPVTNGATPVSNGLFTVTLDFGANFPGAERWLEIAARTNGGGGYSTLSPRQPLTPSPYAITASAVSGPVNGALITAGSVPDAGLSTNVALRSGGNNFSGKQTVSAAGFGIEHTDGTRRLSTYLNGNGAQFGTISSDRLGFFTANGDFQMTLDPNGNVGIGIGAVAPSAKLEVAGTVKAATFVGDGAGLTNLNVAGKGTWILRDEKSSGTAGGSVIASTWTNRTLNTLYSNSASGLVTLLSNQFTIQAGTYVVRASAPVYKVGHHMIRLQNITSSSTASYGTSEFTPTATTSFSSRSLLSAIITINAPATFAIQQYTSATEATDGLGFPDGFPGINEVYTTVEISQQ